MVYYRRAADQGNASAMYNLAACYRHGDGLLQNVPQAVAWFKRSHDAGHADAATRLAEIAPTLTFAQRTRVDQLLATPLPRMPAPAGAGGGAGAGAGSGAGAPPPSAPTS